ncbi:MAG: DNA-directed polymerase subunit beta [Actinomycetota bacterium]
MALRPSDKSSERISFSKINEPLEVPNLLALQRESFDWLIGNDDWKARVKAAKAEGRVVPEISGLEEIFNEVSPIEDNPLIEDKKSLRFVDLEFYPPKYTIEESKEKDKTYSQPLFVSAEFMNHKTYEIKKQTIFLGDFPIMTPQGTFIINGTERVVVSQLVRSPGVYFKREKETGSDEGELIAQVIPNRGAWLEFSIDSKDVVSVKVDRKKKQNFAVIFKALGLTAEQIRERFAQYPILLENLDKETNQTQDNALLDIYRKLRPGEPPTVEAARQLLDNFYFNPKRYDLAKVGRHKINKKLGLTTPLDQQVLTIEDLAFTIEYLVRLHANHKKMTSATGEIQVELDEIDHLGNRRLRTVGELIQNQVRTGLLRMERVVRERMTTQEAEAITPTTLVNIRPLVASIKEFFQTSQLSQFMDQTNSLSGLTHKRRLSALGPGGLSRERAGSEVRDVHPSHYGRMCPIETPEGPNIGLIGSLATFASVNEFGFIQTPFRKVVNGKVTDEISYLTADDEENYVIAQANTPLNDKSEFENDLILVRTRGGEVDNVTKDRVDFMDVSPKQMVSVATAMIPFLEHDDANRALMGANMQRQAVPLVRTEAPLVGTGMEKRAARDASDVVISAKAGVVHEVTADNITVMNDDATYSYYPLSKFKRSNQGTCVNQTPLVEVGSRVEAQDIIADGPATNNGELALGRNLLVAFMPWEGHNYEDAIILSQRLVQDDVLTSIHIEEYEIDAREIKLGVEEITRDLPNVSEANLAKLDERGIIFVGAEVNPGDILVGKITPKGESELTPEERLLRAIFGEKAREVRDTSLKVPHGESGVVIDVKVFDVNEGDELPSQVNQLVRVYIAQKRKITEGDKLAGRHGNKGVISKILPVEDMPFLADGTPVDIILNPLGVPSRMNIGQILETHLGWVANTGWTVTPETEKYVQEKHHQGAPGTKIATPVFDGAKESEVTALLRSTLPSASGERIINDDGKAMLFDGRSGEPFPGYITVGYKYILKLHHLVDDKMHARSTGPYSMVTQQPLGGKAQFGGQRFGEMEVWALEAYGASYALQELLTIKSDDVHGRVKVYEAIVKGENIPEPSIPESFRVLIKEMRSLCLNVEVLSKDGEAIEMRENNEDNEQLAETLGINLSRPEPSSVEEI